MITRGLVYCVAACLLGGATSASSEDRLIAKVAAAVRHNHLAPPRCLQYTLIPSDVASNYTVRISRQHNASCGGDPLVDEALFDVTIDRVTGKMTTNARDPERLEETPLVP